MPRVKSVAASSVLVLLLGAMPASAQSLTISLFERYLDSLREQAGIAGLSFAVVQPSAPAWEQGLGRQDIEANAPATRDTPYHIGGLSQTIGAALTLRVCLEEETLETSDRIVRWVPDYVDPDATVDALLTHATNAGTFAYDPNRFAALTDVVVECADRPYRHVLYERIIERFGMASSMPGVSVDLPLDPGGVEFPAPAVARLGQVARRIAPAYRLDRGRLVRSDVAAPALSTATGVVASVHDLVLFDQALSTGVIIQPEQLDASWTQATPQGAPLPSGRGWFVQNYKGEAVVWQFGLIPGGHSGLIVKVPARGLTFIALANTDGLTATSNLAAGDVTASPFAALFLRFFVP